MSSAYARLTDRMEALVWDESNDDISWEINRLVDQHMLFNFFTNDAWHLQKYAKMKAKEHSKLQEDIQTLQRTKPEDHCGSLETLITHHENIAERYTLAAKTCTNL